MKHLSYEELHTYITANGFRYIISTAIFEVYITYDKYEASSDWHSGWGITVIHKINGQKLDHQDSKTIHRGQPSGELHDVICVADQMVTELFAMVEAAR